MKLFLVLIINGLLSAPSMAASTDMIDQNGFHADFKRLDVDSNNKLSFGEVEKENYFKAGFSKADRNKNNMLSYDEYANFKSAQQQKETKRVASDSSITSKIKSKYLVEKNFKSFAVSVETMKGVVVLSGFVDSEEVKARAEAIAKSVSGVQSVSNGLVVKQ